MVKRIVNWAAVAVLIAVAAVVIWRLWPRPERAVRKRLAALAEAVSRRPGETNSVMALKMNRLPGLFDDTFEVEIQGFPANGTYSGSEMTSHVARMRPMFSRIDLTFYDVSVAFDGPDRATVELTARLTVERASGDETSDIRELVVTLVRRDGSWRFSRFREAAVLVR
jgi:hypothetical protein